MVVLPLTLKMATHCLHPYVQARQATAGYQHRPRVCVRAEWPGNILYLYACLLFVENQVCACVHTYVRECVTDYLRLSQ